jgi:hypothetical protein
LPSPPGFTTPFAVLATIITPLRHFHRHMAFSSTAHANIAISRANITIHGHYATPLHFHRAVDVTQPFHTPPHVAIIHDTYLRPPSSTSPATPPASRRRCPSTIAHLRPFQLPMPRLPLLHAITATPSPLLLSRHTIAGYYADIDIITPGRFSFRHIRRHYGR